MLAYATRLFSIAEQYEGDEAREGLLRVLRAPFVPFPQNLCGRQAGARTDSSIQLITKYPIFSSFTLERLSRAQIGNFFRSCVPFGFNDPRPFDLLRLDADKATRRNPVAHWGEHPNHPMKEWQAEVHCKNTRIGYWDWVVTQLKLAADKSDAKTVLADAEEEAITELQAADPGNQGA